VGVGERRGVCELSAQACERGDIGGDLGGDIGSDIGSDLSVVISARIA